MRRNIEIACVRSPKEPSIEDNTWSWQRSAAAAFHRHLSRRGQALGGVLVGGLALPFEVERFASEIGAAPTCSAISSPPRCSIQYPASSQSELAQIPGS